MKTISQLLELAKNPYYKFLPNEQQVLDDFLAKKRDSQEKPSHKGNFSDSLRKTRVTVRNVVEKMDTYAPDSRTVS